MTDEEVVRLAEVRTIALDISWRSTRICAQSPSYFLIGDREDIIQEGTIGLYKAIRDLDKLSPFKAFAGLVPRARSSTRSNPSKHIANSTSHQQPITTTVEHARSTSLRREKRQSGRNSISAGKITRRSRIRSADAFRFRAGGAHELLRGKTYQEIARELAGRKSIDNAARKTKTGKISGDKIGLQRYFARSSRIGASHVLLTKDMGCIYLRRCVRV